MKKIILWTISIVAIASALVFVDSLPKHDKEEIELFKSYQSDFELITEYIIENYDTETEEFLGLYWENEVPYLYESGEITLSSEIENAFNNIVNAFKNYEFSFVEITPERISYGGLGYRMYVYSRNGKIPRYFYHEGDTVQYTCYSLGENWHLLVNNAW